MQSQWYVPAAVFLGMILTSGMAGEITVALNPTEFPTSVILGSLWCLVLVTLGAWVTLCRPSLKGLLSSNPFYWAALALALLSILWSADPLWSIRGLAMLGTTFLIAAVLAVGVSRRAGYLLLHGLFGFAIIGSVLVALIWPDMGVQRAGWRGLFGGRSWLGNAAALWAILWIAPAFSRRDVRSALFATIAAVCAVWVLLKTGSASAKLSLFAGVYVLTGLVLIDRGWLRVWHFLVFTLVMLTVLLGLQEQIYQALGRNIRWAGRTDVVWPALWPLMLERPWLGYGYDAWLHAEGVVDRLPDRWAPKALAGADVHHGLIRMQLDIGVAGVLLVMAMFAQFGARIVRWLKTGQMNILRYTAVGLWAVIIVNQMTEPSIFMPVSLTVLLLVYTAYVTYEDNQFLPWDRVETSTPRE